MRLPDLPDWVPETACPYAYEETWKAMTRKERQWSFVFDMAIVAIIVVVTLVMVSVS